MRALWSIACLDLLLWSRMPIAIAATLVPPITMAFLLVVLSLAVTQQPVALVVEGQGDFAQKMAAIIRADDDAYLLTVTDSQTARRLLANQEVAAVITVPDDFDRLIAAGEVARVKLLLNNVDIDFADDIRRSVDRSVYRFDRERNPGPSPEEILEIKTPKAFETAADEQRENEIMLKLSRGDNPYLVRIDEQDLRKTNVRWLDYQVIPVLVLLVLNVGLVGTALFCARDIERKTATHLVLAPQRSWVLVAGRLAGGFLASILALVPALAIGLATGTVAPPANHLPALAAVFAATALFASGLGATIGSLLSGERTIALAACVLATYLFLLGGGFTTIAFLPEWLRVISAFVPTRYAIDGMRQALFYSSLDGVGFDLAMLCLAALICCLVGSFSVRRTWLN